MIYKQWNNIILGIHFVLRQILANWAKVGPRRSECSIYILYLWRHVLKGAGEGLSAGTDTRQAFTGAEVGDLDHPAVGVDKHIVALREHVNKLIG